MLPQTRHLFTALLGLGISASAHAGMPIFQTNNLASNRYNALPNETLQLTTVYDGAPGNATLFVEFRDTANNSTGWISVNNIPAFSPAVTQQYHLNGSVPTGRVFISGVATDGGAVDGVVFGLFWKDASGGYHLLKSNSSINYGSADFYGSWPIGYPESTFTSNNVPQVTDWFARNQAYMSIAGAKMLNNGYHTVAVY